MSPAPTATPTPMSPKRPVEEELGRGKRLKVPSWKVRRNLDVAFENLDAIKTFENPVENDEDPVEKDEDFDTEEEIDLEPKPERKKKNHAKKERPQYQNTLDLLWGRFRLSVTLIALVINTVCE